MIYRAARPAAGADDEKLLEWLGISRTPKKVLSEVTYFTCLKMLSETLAKMPIKFYQQTDRGVEEAETNKAYELLKTRPNPQMTPSTFWATVENNRNHYGNAYVWIRREFNRMMYGGEIEIKDLWIMPSADTTIVIDDKGVFGDSGDIYYWYTDKYSGESYIFPSGDVLHFKTSMTFDGYSGAPVREILKATIEGGLESQNFLNNLYKGGLTARAVLQYTGDMSPKLEKALIARLEEYANGANNAGKFIPIPIGMKIEPLNIKLTDSQFFELKKYSALQIAGAFGIKPNQINDYEKSSYAKPSSITWGNADDMRKEADILDGCQKVILNTYMQHAKEGVTAEEIDSLINAETWKNGKEWQEFFDIEVSEKSQATACKSEYFDKYNHLPDKLKEQPQQQINIDDLAERVAEKLKDATQPEVPKIPENDVKRKTAEILEDLELI